MIEETEPIQIQRTLRRAGGSVSKTAALLGISRKTQWKKMKAARHQWQHQGTERHQRDLNACDSSSGRIRIG
jgi:DNA-binding NtrC family response regulator